MGTGELLFERLGRAAGVPGTGTWWRVEGLMLLSILKLTFGASS